MERYEEWDMTIPPIPPRSRLYRLESIGIGTPYVESLTSYITRLAEVHCVSLKALIMWEIFPLQGQDFTWAWGNNGKGQLGVDPIVVRTMPEQVVGPAAN